MSLKQAPDKLYGDLFTAVQTSCVFPDSKTFADAIPKQDPQKIVNAYQKACQQHNFDLQAFVYQHFDLPTPRCATINDKSRSDIRKKIDLLWSVLGRKADTEDNSSLLALPYPYIVPGGRFREIYYWDSYFTMLGLVASGRTDMVESMLNNFAYLLNATGLIPNGNRSYYCSRSQPPFFSLMIELLSESLQQADIYTRYLPQLQIEYNFWMAGSEKLVNSGDCYRRVVRIDDTLLNRYWDDNPVPRQESYREDIELAGQASCPSESLFRNIRAACETGWDFSSRWFTDPNDMTTICTTDIIPVDLNSMLFKTEQILAKGYLMAGEESQHKRYSTLAEQRKAAIQQYFFDTKQQFFIDLYLPGAKPSLMSSLAGVFPLFCNLATEQQAAHVAKTLQRNYLKKGGWLTTPRHTSHQWDAPNGWAPLQWVTYTGLQNYGFNKLAKTGAQRWVENNITSYRKMGSLLEKYNVEQIGVTAGGGEYEVQHGFGWTNGVLLRLMNELGV